jgi:hypothetical protein
MSNQKHLTILKRGVRGWNEWREKSLEIPDLSDADLHEEFFSNWDFSGVNLSDTNLTGANLSGTNLSGANLSNAILTGAVLIGANLCNAILTGADLTRAILAYADFERADAGYTMFADCDLSQAKGLDLVTHRGPSTIGLDTIYQSKAKISESFLRGCGVQEGFIDYMRSLVGAVEGIQFYSCFISYSSKDDEFARRLHGKMRDAHLRVWFAPEEMKGGNLLIEQIEAAIRIYDKLLVVLSEASLHSQWVMTELRRARKAERQSGKRKLFPVRLVDYEILRDWECFDADSGRDLAVELREYFIPDFSNWKDYDQFETAFTRLHNDLRAEGAVK